MRALILLPLALAGCAHDAPVVRDRVETVSVPLIQKCASERPAPVVPMNQRIAPDAWEAMSPKQRAEMAAAQGLERMSHADALNAATAAC